MNLEIEKVEETDTEKNSSIINDLLNINASQKQEEKTTVNIKDNISKGYQIIENIQSNKIDKFQGMKDFLLNLDVITKNVDKNQYEDSIITDLKKIIEESKKDVLGLIDRAPSTQEISSSLDTILIKIEGALDNKKNKINSSIHFEKIDRLYLKMYDAMQNDDKKRVAFYRGRLIRELKKENKTISQIYEDVKALDEIDYILKNDASLIKINDVLSREENKEYKELLSTYLNNENNFRTEFQKIYDTREVRRITLYYNALKEELKNQRIYYQKRYDEEFLGKKGNIITTLKSFPTAMALSVKSIANSINELQEAKTNKMKIRKFLDTIKGVGKFAITPVIASGKFLMSNWYTLLQLYRGPYQAAKEQQKKAVTTEKNNQDINENINENENNASQDNSLKPENDNQENNVPSPNEDDFVGPRLPAESKSTESNINNAPQEEKSNLHVENPFLDQKQKQQEKANPFPDQQIGPAPEDETMVNLPDNEVTVYSPYGCEQALGDWLWNIITKGDSTPPKIGHTIKFGNETETSQSNGHTKSGHSSGDF